MIREIKKKVEKIKGKTIKISVDVGRNKRENYEGIILETYQNVWIFKTAVDFKSFGYNDIITNSVVIIE